jgi:predicted DNA-binding transcriptional regulator AlpA
MNEPTKVEVVTLTLEELKFILEQVVERSVTRALAANQNGHDPDDRLVSADEAADFLGYSKDWIYRHWKKIGGRKIGAKGLRFSRHDLERWAASRKAIQ